MNMQDWQATPLVLGQKTQALISEEQNQLLYQPRVPPKTKDQDDDDGDLDIEDTSFPRPGWNQDNIVSARNAWSKVRLREKKLYGHAGGQLAVPHPTDPSQPPKAIHVTQWYNEDVAEEDHALAVLSEGAQIYLRSILEKAIYCARQRQNVDGIRLWHTQVMSAVNSNSNSSSGSSKNSSRDKDRDDNGSKNEKPPLTLRLGCDVSRQVARTAANAALINQRMEEALERQTDVPSRKRTLDDETLEHATSMSEIALLPRMGRAVDHAEVEAARANEIAGGKLATTEPPLGRVPKQAKLEVIDFQNGMQLAMRPGRHRASVVSGAFSF